MVTRAGVASDGVVVKQIPRQGEGHYDTSPMEEQQLGSMETVYHHETKASSLGVCVRSVGDRCILA